MPKKTILQNEKILESSSTFAGGMSILSSWQVCHTLCTSTISLLALIGITVRGMPFLFLQKFALPFWSAAVVAMLIVLLMKAKGMACASRKFLLLNTGLIVAGTPFKAVQNYTWLFMAVGFVFVVISIVMYVREKYKI